MPDIGIVEMVVIGLILFLVVGPERMPELFSEVSEAIRKVRLWVQGAKSALSEQARELKDPILQAREVVRGEVEAAKDEASGGLHEELRETGEVMKQRPLSEIYAEMQQQKPDDNSTNKGFMQDYAKPERLEKDKKSDDQA